MYDTIRDSQIIISPSVNTKNVNSNKSHLGQIKQRHQEKVPQAAPLCWICNYAQYGTQTSEGQRSIANSRHVYIFGLLCLYLCSLFFLVGGAYMPQRLSYSALTLVKNTLCVHAEIMSSTTSKHHYLHLRIYLVRQRIRILSTFCYYSRYIFQVKGMN